MNIQRINEALEEDQGNSALVIICSELERQGYSVNVNSIAVNGVDVYEGQYEDLEKLTELEFELLKDGKVEQKFIIEFVDFHKVIYKSL